MAHPLKPAESSAHKFGGRPEDYLTIHNWFDESKSFLGDFLHRALRHHTEGIFLAERIFGVAIKNSEGKQVPVRYLGEQHVKEDLGRIPTAADWLSQIRPQRWMYGQILTRAEMPGLKVCGRMVAFHRTPRPMAREQTTAIRTPNRLLPKSRAWRNSWAGDSTADCCAIWRRSGARARSRTAKGAGAHAGCGTGPKTSRSRARQDRP